MEDDVLYARILLRMTWCECLDEEYRRLNQVVDRGKVEWLMRMAEERGWQTVRQVSKEEADLVTTWRHEAWELAAGAGDVYRWRVLEMGVLVTLEMDVLVRARWRDLGERLHEAGKCKDFLERQWIV